MRKQTKFVAVLSAAALFIMTLTLTIQRRLILQRRLIISLIVNKVQNNVLYANGKRIKADTNYRYQAVDGKGNVCRIDSDNTVVAGAKYLVNTSGTVMKSTLLEQWLLLFV